MKTSAEICRENGWDSGTKLVGDEGYGPEVIEITAVGTSNILARSVSINGKTRILHEGLWSLDRRDWKPC